VVGPGGGKRIKSPRLHGGTRHMKRQVHSQEVKFTKGPTTYADTEYIQGPQAELPGRAPLGTPPPPAPPQQGPTAGWEPASSLIPPTSTSWDPQALRRDFLSGRLGGGGQPSAFFPGRRRAWSPPPGIRSDRLGRQEPASSQDHPPSCLLTQGERPVCPTLPVSFFRPELE